MAYPNAAVSQLDEKYDSSVHPNVFQPMKQLTNNLATRMLLEGNNGNIVAIQTSREATHAQAGHASPASGLALDELRKNTTDGVVSKEVSDQSVSKSNSYDDQLLILAVDVMVRQAVDTMNTQANLESSCGVEWDANDTVNRQDLIDENSRQSCINEESCITESFNSFPFNVSPLLSHCQIPEKFSDKFMFSTNEKDAGMNPGATSIDLFNSLSIGEFDKNDPPEDNTPGCGKPVGSSQFVKTNYTALSWDQPECFTTIGQKNEMSHSSHSTECLPEWFSQGMLASGRETNANILDIIKGTSSPLCMGAGGSGMYGYDVGPGSVYNETKTTNSRNGVVSPSLQINSRDSMCSTWLRSEGVDAFNLEPTAVNSNTSSSRLGCTWTSSKMQNTHLGATADGGGLKVTSTDSNRRYSNYQLEAGQRLLKDNSLQIMQSNSRHQTGIMPGINTGTGIPPESFDVSKLQQVSNRKWDPEYNVSGKKLLSDSEVSIPIMRVCDLSLKRKDDDMLIKENAAWLLQSQLYTDPENSTEELSHALRGELLSGVQFRKLLSSQLQAQSIALRKQAEEHSRCRDANDTETSLVGYRATHSSSEDVLLLDSLKAVVAEASGRSGMGSPTSTSGASRFAVSSSQRKALSTSSLSARNVLPTVPSPIHMHKSGGIELSTMLPFAADSCITKGSNITSNSYDSYNYGDSTASPVESVSLFNNTPSRTCHSSGESKSRFSSTNSNIRQPTAENMFSLMQHQNADAALSPIITQSKVNLTQNQSSTNMQSQHQVDASPMVNSETLNTLLNMANLHNENITHNLPSNFPLSLEGYKAHNTHISTTVNTCVNNQRSISPSSEALVRTIGPTIAGGYISPCQPTNNSDCILDGSFNEAAVATQSKLLPPPPSPLKSYMLHQGSSENCLDRMQNNCGSHTPVTDQSLVYFNHTPTTADTVSAAQSINESTLSKPSSPAIHYGSNNQLVAVEFRAFLSAFPSFGNSYNGESSVDSISLDPSTPTPTADGVSIVSSNRNSNYQMQHLGMQGIGGMNNICGDSASGNLIVGGESIATNSGSICPPPPSPNDCLTGLMLYTQCGSNPMLRVGSHEENSSNGGMFTPNVYDLQKQAWPSRKFYKDDRDRMVYVSWIPKKGRAYNAVDKRKMELDFKQKLRDMDVTGLTKVLLFPPKGVHCKLIFDSRISAATFMKKYGGENCSLETETWKVDMCKLYDIDMHEKFDKTVVKIEWSQK